MNLATYKELASLLMEVPELVALYEGRSSGFSDAVKAWMTRVEPVMAGGGLPQVSEVSSMKARIVSVERGVLADDSVVPLQRASPSKQRYVGAVSAQAVHRVQAVLHGVIAPFEARLTEAAHVIRRMIIAATQLGLLNSHLSGGGNSVPSLFRSMMADQNLRPLGTRILELVSYEDSLTLLEEGIAEWVESYRRINPPNG